MRRGGGGGRFRRGEGGWLGGCEVGSGGLRWCRDGRLERLLLGGGFSLRVEGGDGRGRRTLALDAVVGFCDFGVGEGGWCGVSCVVNWGHTV